MAELLLVRSGNAEIPVTEHFSMSVDSLRQFIGTRELHYLGEELPPIGETSRVSEFADPDHVVVNLSTEESGACGLADGGYYLVEGLSPADVPRPQESGG
jgi:hypothetical protein